MSGYPTRITRSSLGPTPVNRYEVRDSAREMDGPTIGDLIMWQLSGANVVVPLAWALIEVASGPAWTLISSAEAWDPDGSVVPTVARSGTGAGTITYNAAYPDKDATSITTDLVASAIDSQVLSVTKVARCQVNANKRVVDVRLYDSGAANDWTAGDRFLVRVW